MTFEEILDGISDEAAELLEQYADEIQQNAEDSPEALEDLPEELIATLLALWDQAIDDIAVTATDDTNEQLGDQDTAITEDDKSSLKTVGAYFLLEAMRRSFPDIQSENQNSGHRVE